MQRTKWITFKLYHCPRVWIYRFTLKFDRILSIFLTKIVRGDISHFWFVWIATSTSVCLCKLMLQLWSQWISWVPIFFLRYEWKNKFCIVAILFLSFKRATTMPNKLIDSQHYKRLRRKTLTAFHSLSYFTLTTTRFNLSFLLNFKLLYNDSETGTIFSQLTYLIQTWQKHQKFISNQWPIWNFQMRLLNYPLGHISLAKGFSTLLTDQ